METPENPRLGCHCANADCGELILVRQIQSHEMDHLGETDLPLVGHRLTCRKCGFLAVYSTRQMWLIRNEDLA
jgi:hypothetical protein